MDRSSAVARCPTRCVNRKLRSWSDSTWRFAARNSSQRQDDRTRDRIGDAETAAQVFERIAKRIESGNHLRPRRDARVYVLPLGENAIGTVTGLDDVGMQ